MALVFLHGILIDEFDRVITFKACVKIVVGTYHFAALFNHTGVGSASE